MNAGLAQLDDAFAPEGVAADLAELRFATIGREFWRRRTELLEVAEKDWARLEEDDWLRWTIVLPKVNQRLDRIEDALDVLIAERGQEVMQEARALHDEGRTESAKERLRMLARAADHAGKAKVRADALELRSVIDREAELRRQNALADLMVIEAHTLQRLRDGNAGRSASASSVRWPSGMPGGPSGATWRHSSSWPTPTRRS